MGKTFSFSLSQSFFSLCNLPQRKVSPQLKTTKLMLSSQKIHCGIIKILKFNFLTQNFFSLWWAGDVMGKTFSFSLSQSFFSLCNLPQRKVSTQLQTGYNGSQRVTTGPNGLERVPSQRVPTGLTGGGGNVNDTFIISPILQ
jgi:hypothetical protein